MVIAYKNLPDKKKRRRIEYQKRYNQLHKQKVKEYQRIYYLTHKKPKLDRRGKKRSKIDPNIPNRILIRRWLDYHYNSGTLRSISPEKFGNAVNDILSRKKVFVI